MVVPAGEPVPEAAVGAIASRTVLGRPGSTSALLRKGETLTRAHLTRLAAPPTEIHLLFPDEGELTEDAAAVRLARAVAGSGLRADPARHGEVTLRARHRGWLRVHADRLDRVNRHEGVLAFTAFGERAVDAGAVVAAIKAAPLLLPESVVQAVEADGVEHGPVADVLGFPHRRVALLFTDRLRAAARDRAREHLGAKVRWFGSTLEPVRTVRNEASAVARGLESLRGEADVVLLAGGVSTDPLAPAFEGLRTAGGTLVQVGLPVDPGTACWMGCLGSVPVVGLASCELSGRFTAIDLLMPRLLLGSPVDALLLRGVAEGGLLADEPRQHPLYRDGGR